MACGTEKRQVASVRMPSCSRYLHAMMDSGVAGILMHTRDLSAARRGRKESISHDTFIGGFGETQAHFGMPLASKRDTSFLACWIVASVSYAAEGEVWACTRPVRYG